MKTIEQYKVDGKYICPDCDLEFSKAGIGGHVWRMHTEEGRKFEVQPAKTKEAKKRQNWNKGLTQRDHPSIAQHARTIQEGYNTGRNRPPFTRKHTAEELDKISKARMQHLEEKSGWAGTHHRYASVKAGAVHLHSNWELETAKALDVSCFHWVRPSNWFKYQDQEGQTRRYQPDFYLPELDLYIEVKPYCPPKQQWKLEQAGKQINLLVVKTKEEIKDLENVIKARIAQLAGGSGLKIRWAKAPCGFESHFGY